MPSHRNRLVYVSEYHAQSPHQQLLLKLAQQIQAGLPTMSFASMPGLMEQVAWEEEVGNSLVVREPVGVVGAITPWNYPLHQIAAKVAPALAAGCTVVLKPSEVVPLNAFILAEVIEAAGLPAGVFNLVTGTGPVVGEAIAAHPGVDMVSFTGSTRAGKRVSELAAADRQAGGDGAGRQEPNVILDDADLERAIPDGVAKCFLNSGQTCSALTRMLVPREKLETAEQIAAAAAETFTPGDPFDPATRLGPLVSETQRERVRGYIEKGQEEGARLVTGGAEPPEGLERGYFVRPTVFSEVDPGDDDRPGGDLRAGAGDPALRGRGGRGADRQRHRLRPRRRGLVGRRGAGGRVARRIRTGQVEINGGAFNPLAPFGGYKQSGHGRELGRFAIEEMLQVEVDAALRATDRKHAAAPRASRGPDVAMGRGAAGSRSRSPGTSSSPMAWSTDRA